MTAKKTRRFSLGLDYGTESARAVLVEISTGKLAGRADYSYPDGVIDSFLPGKIGPKLKPGWALQNAQDYLTALKKMVPAVLNDSRVRPEEVVGIGVDFTSCTVLPVKSDGTPLSQVLEFKQRPHAWTKLWKHHGAQDEADHINRLALERKAPFLNRYGGKISSEWMLPKLLEILNDDPEIARAMDKFIEAQDWIVWKMTGCERRSSCGAGYKGTWSNKDGFPPDDFLANLNPKLPEILHEKICGEFYAPGTRAGGLTAQWSALTGLKAGTPVAVSIIDAHAGVIGSGISAPNEMVLCMGTSACHMMLAKEEKQVNGICGMVQDGILPGLIGYEAGQAAVGDIFSWWIRTLGPRRPQKNFADLEKEAAKLKPGQCGLLALDWWNGNRSVLVDAGLSGMILGLTLNTQPHEIYRALLEATAMGTLRIIEQFESAGVPVKRLHATGGLAEKSPFLLQIYADVTGREIELVYAPLVCARGASILGALASEEDLNPLAVTDIVQKMSPHKRQVFTPKDEPRRIYQKIYQEYLRLHDYFGTGQNPVMKNLKKIAHEI